jgi:hypothetical protein
LTLVVTLPQLQLYALCSPMGLVQYSDSEDEDAPIKLRKVDDPVPPTKRYVRDPS